MEKMPYQDQVRIQAGSIPFDWHFGLPTIRGRESHASRSSRERCTGAAGDADERRGRGVRLAACRARSTASGVSSPKRTTSALAATASASASCPDGYEDAMGLFQVRQLEPGFGSAEWGFAIGSPFWGSGMFLDGARAVIDFSFGVVGVHRLEARSITSNGRGNAALRKVGAMQEGFLPPIVPAQRTATSIRFSGRFSRTTGVGRSRSAPNFIELRDARSRRSTGYAIGGQ